MSLTITNTLTPYKQGYDRDFLRKNEVLGEIIAELQDHVENINATFDDNVDIQENAADIEELQDAVEVFQTLPEGSLFVGNSDDFPEAVDFSTDARIPIGDGTTLNSVAVSGDITIDNAGVTTIGAAKVTGAKASTVMATKSVYIPVGTIADTGAVAFTVPVAHAGTLVAAKLCAKDALAADDTNYLTFALTNKGQAGAGSTAMLSATATGTTKLTGGAAIAAYTTRNLPLHATGANAAVVANDCLEFTATVTGTLANSVAEATVRLDFLVTA